jgi:hypothetical protein
LLTCEDAWLIEQRISCSGNEDDHHEYIIDYRYYKAQVSVHKTLTNSAAILVNTNKEPWLVVQCASIAVMFL